MIGFPFFSFFFFYGGGEWGKNNFLLVSKYQNFVGLHVYFKFFKFTEIFLFLCTFCRAISFSQYFKK